MSKPSSWVSKPPTVAPSVPLRQPANLVSDILLEILTWLALDDWDYDAYSYGKPVWDGQGQPPGRALVRATHVCRYWRGIALENKRLWSNIALNDTLPRDRDHADREFTCRVQRTLGGSHPLRLSYVGHSEYEMNDYAAIVNGTDYSRSQTPEPVDWMTTYFRLYPILRDCISRASTLTLSGSSDSLRDLFGWGDMPRRELYVTYLGFCHPEHQNPSGIGIFSLPQLVDLTINIRDHTAAVHFPEIPRLRRLFICLDEMEGWVGAFQLPYSTIQCSPLSYPPFPPLPQERQPLFPELTHLELRIDYLQLDSLNHFLFNHSTTLVDIVLDTDPGDTSCFPIPPCAIPFPGLRSLELAKLSPVLSMHLNMWECPNLEKLRMAIPPDQIEITTLSTRNFSGVKYLTFGFPGVVKKEERPQVYVISEQCAASRLLVSLLVEMDDLIELTVLGWNYAGIHAEEDWFQCLTAQRRPPKLVGSDPPNTTSNSRPSAMWTKISEEGLMVDENGDPYPFSDVDSSVSSDYSHASRDLARIQAHLAEQDAAERERLEREQRRASSSYLSSSDEEEIDRFARRPAPEYIPGPYYACRGLESVRLERCVGVEKSMVFDFWAGRQFLYSHYVRTTYGSPGAEVTAPLDPNTTASVSREDVEAQSSQSSMQFPPSSATDGPPPSPTSPASLYEYRPYSVYHYASTYPQLYPHTPTSPQLYPPPAPAISPITAQDETPSVTERVKRSPAVTLVDCENATHEEIQDLLWRYYMGFYEPFRPRRPRSPSPIPLDECDLWI